MIRFFLLFLMVLVTSFIYLNNRLLKKSETLPEFLTEDKIVQNHITKIEIINKEDKNITPFQIDALKKDYSAIWAHLNYLYNTNNVAAGKEYYTEAWFKQLCKHYTMSITGNIHRNDLHHTLLIQNWSTDGLVCTITDSVLLEFKYPTKEITYFNQQFAVVLLFEGNHWRIDAIKQLEN